MNTQPLLAVRGEGVLEVDPEIAVLSLTVTAKDVDRQKTLRYLDERGRAADKILSRFGEAVQRVVDVLASRPCMTPCGEPLITRRRSGAT